MISDRLYELAFQYKKTKLWQKLWDMQIFAVKLSDGQIGYISIMGAVGEFCALGLYIGEVGFQSLRGIVRHDSFLMSPFAAQERLVQQECLQCAFVGKDELSPQEQEEARNYARSHGVRLGGKNAYPQFIKLQRNCYPWYLQTEGEQEELCQALSAAVELARLLGREGADKLGLARINDDTEDVPMLELKGGSYLLGRTPIPQETPRQWPQPQAANDVGIASLKRANRWGVWECEIIRALKPVQDEPEEVPYFPVILLAVEAESSYILPVPLVKGYEEHPEELLTYFMEALIGQKVCPRELKVRDQRTYGFARDFCHRLRIPICIETEGMEALDEVERDFLAHFDMSEEEEMEEMAEVLNALLELDEEQLRSLPASMVEMLKSLAAQGGLPKKVEKKLSQVFHFEETALPEKKQASGGKKAPAQSYIISASLGTGCYRHIQISENSTLEELHSAILQGFEFDDDHAHAFFMNNRKWSDYDSYFMEGVADGSPTTRGCRLKRLGLYKGKPFKYVFDFGDEWTFQCKVVGIVEGDTKKPAIVRSKGQAPAQYGDYEEDGED